MKFKKVLIMCFIFAVIGCSIMGCQKAKNNPPVIKDEGLTLEEDPMENDVNTETFDDFGKWEDDFDGEFETVE